MFRKLLFGTALAGAMAIATPSQAGIELALVIDGSGSITAADFLLQQQGYINSLNDIYTANPGLYGQNAIGVWQFSSTVQQEFALTVINNAADLLLLTTAIGNMIQIGTNTAIGDAITTAAAAIAALNFATREIIDVSTDGASNTGEDPVTAATNAVAGGVDQVNCLGVGGAANCGFIAGVGSFSLNAASFADFETAIALKLETEFRVPEPTTLAIFGLGLLGMGLVRRRAAA